MRSTIDWNEIVPKLKKELQDTLYLEAVILLSGSAPARTLPAGNRVPPVRHRSHVLPASETKLERQWRRDGDGAILSEKGRHYRINKKTPPDVAPHRGVIGAVWRKLLACQNDVISYEGIAAICKGEKVLASAMIGQLWERKFIEVVPSPEKKVATAY